MMHGQKNIKLIFEVLRVLGIKTWHRSLWY